MLEYGLVSGAKPLSIKHAQLFVIVLVRKDTVKDTVEKFSLFAYLHLEYFIPGQRSRHRAHVKKVLWHSAKK